MSAFAVDGLSSGLDTSSIIQQLVAIERLPIQRLEGQKSGLDAGNRAWSDLDLRLEALQDSIEAIRDDGIEILSGTASDEKVSVTRTTGGSAGTYDLTVDSLATSHQLMSGRFGKATDLVGAGTSSIVAGLADVSVSSIDISALDTSNNTIEVSKVDAGTATILFNGESHDVPADQTAVLTNEDGSTITLVPDGEFEVGKARASVMVADETTTVAGLVAQLSGPAGASSLQIVDTGDGSGQPLTLLATARQAGTDNGLQVNLAPGTFGAFQEIRAAANTVVRFGDGSLTVEREATVLDDVVPGMRVDLRGATIGEQVRVAVARDEEASLERIEGFVNAANTFFSQLSRFGRSDPENNQVGILAGEFSLRRLDSQIRNSFSAVGTGDLVLASQIGITTNRDGTLTLDNDAFAAVLNEDFDAMSEFLFGDGSDGAGYLGRVSAAAAAVTDEGGLIEVAKENLDSRIETLDESIERYERRIEIVEAGLRRQFTAMETLLGQLNSQSSFLSSAIGGLPS